MYLIGTGGHAKVILDLISTSGGVIDGVFDDDVSTKDLLGYKNMGEIKKSRNVNGSFIIAIGNNLIRKKIAEKLKLHYESVIGQCFISQDVSMGKGSVVMNGVCINIGTRIGSHVIINTAARIDHECIIEDYVHISPHVTLAGNVNIQEGAHIGLGAKVIQGICIGRWASIGAGAVIIKNVPDYAVVVGVPGKIIKYANQ